jgi:hypothetical protein
MDTAQKCSVLGVPRTVFCILYCSTQILLMSNLGYFRRLALRRAFATPSPELHRQGTRTGCARHTFVSSRLVLPALPECALWTFVLLGAWEGHNTAGRQVRSHEEVGAVWLCVSASFSGQPAGFRSQWLSPNRGQSAGEIRNLTAAGRCHSSTAHGVRHAANSGGSGGLAVPDVF